MRNTGIYWSEELGKKLGPNWIASSYLPSVTGVYDADKKGYGYRMSALRSMAAVLKYTEDKNAIYGYLLKALQDSIPNVNICAAKICIA